MLLFIQVLPQPQDEKTPTNPNLRVCLQESMVLFSHNLVAVPTMTPWYLFLCQVSLPLAGGIVAVSHPNSVIVPEE